jgi:hypothetical protein
LTVICPATTFATEQERKKKMPQNWNVSPQSWIMSGKTVVAIAAVISLTIPMPVKAADRSPVVVELFTSQGCSSCPPANANLIELSKRPDVLALSFAVTYWDYLGWKDTFDRPEYTDRQVAYEKPLGQQGPYTPQMVINGTATVVGNRLAEVQDLVERTAPLSGPTITLGASEVSIGVDEARSGTADVWLVRYDPNLVEVPVARGENTGRTLPHTHVVHALEHLGNWAGISETFALKPTKDGLKTAILVQAPQGGPILAAATN